MHQHFNDLELRIRNIAITVVGALLAALSFTYKEGIETEIHGVIVPAGVALVLAALFAWVGFFFMDRFWYHILLKGAVKHSMRIEEKYSVAIPAITLSATITEASNAIKPFGLKLNSDRRLELFYAVGFLILLGVFGVLLISKPHEPVKDKLNASAAPHEVKKMERLPLQKATPTPEALPSQTQALSKPK